MPRCRSAGLSPSWLREPAGTLCLERRRHVRRSQGIVRGRPQRARNEPCRASAPAVTRSGARSRRGPARGRSISAVSPWSWAGPCRPRTTCGAGRAAMRCLDGGEHERGSPLSSARRPGWGGSGEAGGRNPGVARAVASKGAGRVAWSCACSAAWLRPQVGLWPAMKPAGCAAARGLDRVQSRPGTCKERAVEGRPGEERFCRGREAGAGMRGTSRPSPAGWTRRRAVAAKRSAGPGTIRTRLSSPCTSAACDMVRNHGCAASGPCFCGCGLDSGPSRAAGIVLSVAAPCFGALAGCRGTLGRATCAGPAGRRAGCRCRAKRGRCNRPERAERPATCRRQANAGARQSGPERARDEPRRRRSVAAGVGSGALSLIC